MLRLHTASKQLSTQFQWRSATSQNNENVPYKKPESSISSFSFSLVSHLLLYVHHRRKFYSTQLWTSCILSARQTLQLEPAQRWHLAGSTGTRPSPVQLNASEALPCVGSRTPSSTRPAPVVWVAGPGRYWKYIGLSRGTCDKQIQSLIKAETLLNGCFERYDTVLWYHRKSEYLILS